MSKKSLFKKILNSVFIVMIVAIICATMILMSSVETNAGQNQFTLTDEEINQAALRAQELTDIIMSGDEFIFDGEVASDYVGIHDYINNKPSYSIEDLFVSDDVSDEELEMAEAEVVEDQTEEELNEEFESDIVEENIKVLPDSSDWRLILVNKQNKVPDDYDAKLANINGSQMADERIIEDIYKMLDAAKADGINLMICSAYRSYDRQTTLFNNKMNKLLNKGMSYMEAYAVGSMSVTVPGTSEHQLGLALDILTSDYLEMDDGFGETAAGKWLCENAPSYGFILRYPKGKEDITGIIYEPWHFRYVSTDYSMEITNLGVTLEEYLSGEY